MYTSAVNSHHVVSELRLLISLNQDDPVGRNFDPNLPPIFDVYDEDVPYSLESYPNPLTDSPAYAVVKQYFVHTDDYVMQKIVVHKDIPRGIHFRRAGPRQKVYFISDEVHACIVTCGGLCPGLNTVIREIVCGFYHMYGVSKVIGIDGGYRGFYAKNTKTLDPIVVNDIHKRGGTILGTSRGSHDTTKIVDSNGVLKRNYGYIKLVFDPGIDKRMMASYEPPISTLTAQESGRFFLKKGSMIRIRVNEGTSSLKVGNQFNYSRE